MAKKFCSKNSARIASMPGLDEKTLQLLRRTLEEMMSRAQTNTIRPPVRRKWLETKVRENKQ